MQPYQQRVVEEKKQLDERLDALQVFFAGDIFPELDISERSRLSRQSVAMQGYSDILAERIAAFCST